MPRGEPALHGLALPTARLAAEAPLCLDLTRLVRRLGRGPLTGIDRVECAWLGRALIHGPPVFGLVRSARGFLLLDRAGMRQVQDWAAGTPLPTGSGHAGLLAWPRLRAPHAPQARALEATLATLALARCSRLGLARLLRRSLPAGTHYLNVGHSNLQPRSLLAWATVPGARVAVLLHDVIPLDLPQTQRPQTVAGFAARLPAVAATADLVLHVSAAARVQTEARLAAAGRVPPGLVAHPGITLAMPTPQTVPPGLLTALGDAPFFLTLGTIEPRKNHALLLDLWEHLAQAPALRFPPPHLVIAGRRGWASKALFARLDALRRPGTLVHEENALDDGAVATLMLRARALLMPSLAEGFGLPVLEAAARGLPVLATALPVYRETLGSRGVYLPPHDLYSWQQAVLGQAVATHKEPAPAEGQEWLPTWQAHFSRVLERAW